MAAYNLIRMPRLLAEAAWEPADSCRASLSTPRSRRQKEDTVPPERQVQQPARL